MEIPVLIEEVPGAGFRAAGGEPFACVAEGSTRDEALSRLEELVRQRIAAGAQLVAIDVPAATNPWTSLFGVLRDEPLFDEWKEAIATRRRELDADPDVP